MWYQHPEAPQPFDRGSRARSSRRSIAWRRIADAFEHRMPLVDGLVPAVHSGSGKVLDEVLPHFDVSEVHGVWVPIPADIVYQAVTSVCANEVRLLMPFEVLRGMPRLLMGGRAYRPNPTRPLLETFTEGAIPLGERMGEEIVAGAIGRFWRLFGNEAAPVSNREEFAAFAEPGYAKAAIDFMVSSEANGTRVVTETRVVGTSAKSSRIFRLYWHMIRPASGAIRRSWLAAIRRRAINMCELEPVAGRSAEHT